MEKFGVIKKKSLLFIMVAGVGGLEQGPGGKEPRPPKVLWMDSIASQLGGIRVPGLFCIVPQLLSGPLVKGLRSWGALFPPFHLLRS